MMTSAITAPIQTTLLTSQADWESVALLHRINPVRNEARFYYVLVGPAFLDRHAVIRVWGRIGGQQRGMVTPCHSDEEARTLANRLIQRRLKRGYTLIQDEPGAEK